MSNRILLPVLFTGFSVLLTGAIAPAQGGENTPPRPYATEAETSAPSPLAPPAAASPTARRELAGGGNPLSAGIDRNRLHFDVDADGTVWVRGRTYKASFSQAAVTYIPFLGSQAPRNFPLALHVESATIGGAPIAFDADAPAVLAGDAVEYDRGGFRERYVLTPDSVEQTFVFDVLPTRGEIALTVGVHTELAPTEAADGFRFANELGHVQYGRAFAYDALQSKAPIASRLESGRIEIVAPHALVESAVGAFVIDPVLTTFSIDAGLIDEFAADTAYDGTTATWLTVCEEVYSLDDHDIHAVRHTTSGTFSASTYVDFTGTTWRTPAVANNNLDDQFLVVAARGEAPTREIWGRTVEATASQNMSVQFEIGVDVLPVRDMYAPDVGGDPSGMGADFYCVVWEREFTAGTDYNIVAARVRTDAMPNAFFFIDSTGATIHRNPAISNSTGNAVLALRDWNVVWEDEVAPTNRNILGARVHYDGTLTAGTFTVASSILDERNPSVTSIVDETGGTRPWMVAYQIDSGANGWDVRCRTFNGTSSISTFDLSEEFPTVALDQVTPSCDTAHGQFLVAWDERPGGFFASTDLRIASLYSIGGSLGVIEGDLSVSPGIHTDLRPKVVTQGSSGSSNDDALVVFDRDDSGPNDILGTSYDLPNGGPVSAYCAGDGSGTACPCGNNGAAGHGCASSVNAFGAELRHNGGARVSNDTLQLVAEGLPATAPALFFQGTGQTAAGAGAVFGDGLRCAGGVVIRLTTRTAVGGLAVYPGNMVETNVSVLGAVPSIGALRFYQCWYRNAAAFCTPSTFNLTNGLRVQWIP